jgi:multidrug transporter EmrE-like cation transporter
VRPVAITLLAVLNLACTLLSNVAFKWSALSVTWREFITWQVVGNLAGLASVITFTLLLRLIPLNVAYAVTAGLGFVLVQAVGASFIFHEGIAPIAWFGSALIVMGILLVSWGR